MEELDAPRRLPATILSGSLREIPVPQLLQVLGILELPDVRVRLHASGHEPGEVWMTGKHVRHARAGHGSGREALRRMLAWTEGVFRVERERWEGDVSVDEPVEAILLGELIEQDLEEAQEVAEG